MKSISANFVQIPYDKWDESPRFGIPAVGNVGMNALSCTVPLRCGYGTTEVGLGSMFQSSEDPRNWGYVCFPSYIGAAFDPQNDEDETYELGFQVSRTSVIRIIFRSSHNTID